MKRILILMSLLMPVFLNAQQIAKSLTGSNGVFIGFYEYKPTDYNTNTTVKYPCIIFLHGVGEKGNGTTDLFKVKRLGPPQSIGAGHTMRFYSNGKWETFIVLSPQLSTAYGSWPTFYVDELIKYATQNLRVDPARIHLTGLSLGGSATWSYVSSSITNASKLASIAPVAAGNLTTPCNVASAGVSVWAFHGQNDNVYNVTTVNNNITKILNCNPTKPVLKTVYAGLAHFIYDRAYDVAHTYQNPNMYEWFLAQNRSGNLPLPNVSPTALAGSDAVIVLPTSSVTVNGNNSSDPDGSIVSYKWTKVSGPTTFTIASPSAASTAINSLVQGAYTFRLTVTDNKGATDYDDVIITVNSANTNIVPVANAGSDATITLPTNTTTLNGSTSSDADGTIASHKWTKVNGPTTFSIASPNAATTALNNLVQGTYTLRLTVTDNKGATDYDDVIVKVNAASTTNLLPIVKAGPDATITLPTNSVTLNGSNSSDPDGTVATSTFTWSKVNGPTTFSIATPTKSITAVNNLVQGTYTFRLTMKDSKGGTSYDDVVITVNASVSGNLLPIVKAGPDATIELPTSSVILNGSNSYDPDGTVAGSTFTWSKLSGPSSLSFVTPTKSITTVNNLSQGIYTFRLTMKDINGGTSTDDVVITVNGSTTTNILPIVKAGPNATVTLPTSYVTLNGSNSSDPDGAVANATFAWSKVSGPTTYTIEKPTNSISRVLNLVQGTYTFRLTMRDSEGGSAYDDVVVTVLNAPTTQANTGRAIGEVSTIQEEKIIAYPNPAVDHIIIQCVSTTLGKGVMHIYDITGKTVKKIAFQKNQTITQETISLSGLVSGLYHVEIIIGNKSRMQTRFIKK